MGKWIAGIIAGIIIIVGGWALTTVLPEYLEEPPPPPPVDDSVRVGCTSQPGTVPPGGTSEITVKVTRGGEPVADAEVKVEAGGGTPATSGGITVSDGTTRVRWKAPPTADGITYHLRATAKLADQEGGGSGEASCAVLVAA